MRGMENNRKTWMKQQTALRKLVEGANPLEQGLEILLSQHARLHAVDMSGSEPWSFSDEVLEGLSEQDWRTIPSGGEHSIAWMIWHIARIEDTAMNLLVAGQPQVLDQENWGNRMKATPRSAGNELDSNTIQALGDSINLQALAEYRTAVGRQTRQIIQGLKLEDLKEKVLPARIEQVLQQGAIDPLNHAITD